MPFNAVLSAVLLLTGSLPAITAPPKPSPHAQSDRAAREAALEDPEPKLFGGTVYVLDGKVVTEKFFDSEERLVTGIEVTPDGRWIIRLIGKSKAKPRPKNKGAK